MINRLQADASTNLLCKKIVGEKIKLFLVLLFCFGVFFFQKRTLQKSRFQISFLILGAKIELFRDISTRPWTFSE